MIPASPRSAVVIGGGIVGLSVALALQARGLVVTVFDDPGGSEPASFGNAGHIATEQHEPLASWATLRSLPRRLMCLGGPASFPLHAAAQWLPFGLRLLGSAHPATYAGGKQALGALLAEALPAWERIMNDTGRPDLVRHQGNIVVWESIAGARRGRAALGALDSRVARARDLTADEAALLGGQVRGRLADAVRIDGTASVADPAVVLQVLRRSFCDRGGTLDRQPATLAQARRAGADIVVIAAGVRSTAPMRELGHATPMIAERGYHIHAPQTRWPTSLTSVVFEERALVVTRFLSGLRATSFVEFTRPDAPPDARKWARLEAHAEALGLPFDGPLQTWVGSRPTLPDYLPAIGRSTKDPRVLYAFGHHHLGLTLGPVTGERVAALACADKAALDLAPYAIDRFRRGA